MFKKTNSNKRLLIAGLCLAMAVVAFESQALNENTITAEAEKNSSLSTNPYRLQLQFKTGMAQASSLSDEKTAGFFRMDGIFDYKFVTGLSFHSNVTLNMLSQRMQQDIPVSDAFDEGLRLKQGYVGYQALENVELDAGVVNQWLSYGETPFLIDNRGFPGLMQQLTFKNGQDKFQLLVEEAIPTSRSFDADRVQKETMPLYFSEGLKYEWRPNEDFSLTPYALHYTFSNLPSVIAWESNPLGNTLMSGSTEGNARFAYAFDGVVAGAKMNWHFMPHYSSEIGYQVIRNLKAPQAFNSGALLSAGVCYCSANIEVKPALLAFFNESDTAPAAYNDGRFGHNNREGQGGELELKFPKLKFSTIGRFINSEVINDSDSIHQSHQQFFEIFLETADVDIL